MSRGATMTLLGLFNYDPSILSDAVFHIPAEINRGALIMDLLAEAASFEILYPDINFLRGIIHAWSTHMRPIWERMVKAANLEYNPIENYDRIEEWTDSGSGNSSHSDAGYNPGTASPVPMVEQTRENSNGSSQHHGRTHGNIGVTTSQQMLEQELSVSKKLNITKVIINDFIARFCIPLY